MLVSMDGGRGNVGEDFERRLPFGLSWRSGRTSFTRPGPARYLAIWGSISSVCWNGVMVSGRCDGWEM